MVDIDTFFRLADYYASVGDYGQNAIKDIAAGDTEGQPALNIESAKRFLKRLAEAGIETYGAEEEIE
jgi:hypothetical protein